ncbi:unnamed protein product [Ambrosiozyma monospora]|uniref:Unnamed protein product n=1 Tax=Ambrosiozyma monospora TaxID=43982 RepID=A0ACB5U2I2_AMBMO|nr:unnamed protein product [Ambrosiozyma monospora]
MGTTSINDTSYSLKLIPKNLELANLLLAFKKAYKLTDDDFELIRVYDNNDGPSSSGANTKLESTSNGVTPVYIRFFQAESNLDNFIQFLKDNHKNYRSGNKEDDSDDIQFEIIATEEELNLQLPGNLYIRGLLPTTKSEDLYNIFKPFGDIKSCKIIYDDFGVSKGFGFISFANRKQANDAIENLHGCNVDGNDLFINHHISKKERLKEMEFRKMNYSNLYIKNLPPEMTTDSLRELFQRFGDIENVFIPSDRINNSYKRGYGFINFKYHDDALKAQDEMNGQC